MLPEEVTLLYKIIKKVNKALNPLESEESSQEKYLEVYIILKGLALESQGTDRAQLGMTLPSIHK